MSDHPKQQEEIILQGYPICPGIAIGHPVLFVIPDEHVPEFSVSNDKIEKEVSRYYKALRTSKKDLVSLQKKMRKEGGDEAASILGSHIEIMQDPLMTIRVEKEIRKKGKNTEYVFKSVVGEYEEKFKKIPDAFFRERMKDFQDISRRVIKNLRKHEQCSLKFLTSPSIVFANELLPSDTAEASSDYIEAFVTKSGSETSHVAIMARAKGIPFVSCVDFADFAATPLYQVIVDGSTGEVVFNPTPATLAAYEAKKKKFSIQVKGLQSNASANRAETVDGYHTSISANIEVISELDMLHEYGGEGIGLFRSEYLFLAQEGFPSEDEQFSSYRSMVEKIDGQPCVIRTFDIGGDKLGSINMNRHEKNPYLGCRAIRLMLKEQSLFKAQLRAILRASAFGEISILFPMISGVAEVRQAKALIEVCKEELVKEGVPFTRNIRTGCMIEIPSAAITSEILAEEVDFLSIGTNDLVQYTLAVDRGNPAMSYLYTPTHPSIIRLIHMVVQAGNRKNTPVYICGEIAADPRYTALLLGLGVHELSVSVSSLPIIKNMIRRLSIVEAKEFADYILTLTTADEVEQAILDAYKKVEWMGD